MRCSLKPETNLALMLCLVFYLYICLGGALFLLLEGQGDTTNKLKKEIRKDIRKLVVSIRIAIHVLEEALWKPSIEYLFQKILL